MKCSYCGSENIVEGIVVGQLGEVGEIGLDYSVGAWNVETEPLLATLCKECGTVVRMYVSNTIHDWNIEEKCK